MQLIHSLEKTRVDFLPYIERHSADEILTYKAVNGESLMLGIFYPPAYRKGNKYPVFFFIHGGGWKSRKIFIDQKEWAGDYLGYLARYYAEKGYISVSIDYRLLSQKNTLMDLIEDCADALSFIKDKAEELGIDIYRSILLGESAGGYLAGALETFYRQYGFNIQKIILVNSILDMTDNVWGKNLPNGWDCRQYSPAHQVDDETSETLLIHGREDSSVNPSHSQVFYERMCLYKQNVQLHWLESTKHAFLLAEYMLGKGKSLSATEKAIQIINDFIVL